MSAIARQSLTGKVYEHLVTHLASRKLKLGAILTQRQFIKELGVSNTTVNKALERLISSGWVQQDEEGRLVLAAYPPKGRKPVASTFDYSNQTDNTYETVLERILRGDYKPGDTLKERPVALALGVNPATVRRAAEWLRNDGLLERLPRRGWRVVKLHIREVKDIFQVRLLLEPLVIQLVVHRISDETLDRLEAESKALAEAGEKVAPYDRRGADQHFHLTLLEASGSSVLIDILGPLVRKLMLITTVRYRFMRSAQSFSEHQRIIQALRQHDVSRAKRAMRVHLQNALRHNLDTWEEP